jgi:NADH:ubiquinone oxidoreductase subunit 5 (subunit L)/multisubunit Na+/H+ antiporter MnhA subunit
MPTDPKSGNSPPSSGEGGAGGIVAIIAVIAICLFAATTLCGAARWPNEARGTTLVSAPMLSFWRRSTERPSLVTICAVVLFVGAVIAGLGLRQFHYWPF